MGMKEDLNKTKEELEKQSKEYEEEKKKKTEKLIERRANLIGSFVGNQTESEFQKIKKVTYQFSGNAIEDYILIMIHDDKKPMAASSNILGLEHLDGFPQHLAERFFEFAFSNYMELVEIENDTLFEINFEK